MRIAIVCHEYSRIQRMRSLAEGLAAAGHDVFYLSSEAGVSDKRFSIVSIPYSSSRQKTRRALGVPADVNIAEAARKRGSLTALLVRWAARSFEVAFLYPDKYRGWIPAFRTWMASQTVLRDVDLVIASTPPATTLFVGRMLARELDARLIYDFRDLWTDNPGYSLGPLRRAVDRLFEKRLVRTADSITAATSSVTRDLSARHRRSDITTVRTGVDPNVWGTVTPRVPDGTLRFGHIGVWYPGRRTIRPLLDSLRRLAELGRIEPDRVRVDLWGHSDESIDRDVRETGLSEVVAHHGWADPDDVGRLLSTIDVALLLCWPEDDWSIPLKTYHYLAAEKDILILNSAPDGELRRFLAGLPGVAYNDSEEELDRFVAAAWDAVQRGESLDVPLSRRPLPTTPATMEQQFSQLF